MMHEKPRVPFLPGVAGLLACCGLAMSSPAHAATFDPATGRLTLDATAINVPFDDAAATWSALPGTAYDPDWQVIDTADFEHVSDPAGLEGTGALSMGGEHASLYLELSGLVTPLAGRRLVVRFWQRPQGTRASATLQWYRIDPTSQDTVALGMVVFQPTGRATDDGWEEWSAGPVDLQAAGTATATYFTLNDAQLTGTVGGTILEYAREARVLVDALELVDVGPAAVAPDPCTVVDELTACGAEGLCLYGRCVDAAIVAGAVPTVASGVRDDHLDRLGHLYRTFEGGRSPRSRMDGLDAAFDAGRTAAGTRRYWASIQAGVELLQDGHASAPAPNYAQWYAASNLGVCLHLGEADLVPGAGAKPLVFSTVDTNPLASQLREGDALVAIDGLTPLDWAATAGRLISFGGATAAAEVVTAPDLIPAAVRSGSTLTFARCAGPGPCDATTLETVELDLRAALGDPLWDAATLPAWRLDQAACDYRFRRALTDPGVSDYTYAGWADEGGVRTLLINGVPDPAWGAPDWLDIVHEALTSGAPARIIVDQRQGNGGSITTTDYLMALLLEPTDFHAMEIYPAYARELDETLRAEVRGCLDQGCTGGFWWPLGFWSDVGDDFGVAGGARVAVLNASDVSGNDYTSKLFTYRSAPTEIFGPAPSWGAFGPIVSLPWLVDDVLGGSLQAYDTIFHATPGETPLDWETSTGVAPTRLTHQRQSDAVLGIDTTIEAARAWLLEE